MSQEKVSKYKEEKANRKESMKKQKRAKLIRNSVMGIAFAAILAWIGYSAVVSYQENQPRQTAEVNYTAVDDYLAELRAE